MTSQIPQPLHSGSWLFKSVGEADRLPYDAHLDHVQQLSRVQNWKVSTHLRISHNNIVAITLHNNHNTSYWEGRWCLNSPTIFMDFLWDFHNASHTCTFSEEKDNTNFTLYKLNSTSWVYAQNEKSAQFWVENVRNMKMMILLEIWKSSNLSKHWYWSTGISLEEMRIPHFLFQHWLQLNSHN